MNKKEVSEIKRHFTEEDGFFNIGKVVTAFVDAEKNIKYKASKNFNIIEESEAELIMKSLRKVFSGKVSKNLLEYAFPNPAYAPGGTQNILYEATRTKLEDDEKADALLEHITKKMDYLSTYAVFIGYCSYSVFKKTKDGEALDDSDHNYNFIVTAVCPVEIRIDGLVYDEDENVITRKPTNDRVVGENPTDGFVFPAFSEGGADVNHVMYYTRKPKAPNISIINEVLGCRFISTYNDERVTFQSVMNNVVGDELNFEVVTSVNEKISEVVAQNQDDTEPPVIDKERLTRILSESGVSDEKLETLDKVYENIVGETVMRASNLVENRTVVAVPSVTVNIKKDGLSKVKTQTIDGKRCLIIDLEDPDIVVNGLNVN
ncbi:MAG: DUF4317 family protein [Ruminococcus sp.]|nr:DUF4317 family protein [Ruminococcus sp.]